MSLRTIVESLGGDLYDGGARANIPAPGHGPADRSVSLLLKDGRVIVHTFGHDGDWKTVLDHLRRHGLIDRANAPTSISGARAHAQTDEPKTDLRRLDAAQRLWEAGRAVARTLSERHCRLRGVYRQLPGPDVARHCSALPVSAYRDTPRRRPALMTAIRDARGDFTAVEVTYLTQSGRRAEDLRFARKTVGPVPPSTAVRIDPPAPEMLVAEGFFTTLSATERFSLPGWALLSRRNLETWIPPAGVRSVLIAGDRGRYGEASAQVLAERLRHRGIRVRVELPPAPFGDFNDWEQALRRRTEADGRAESEREGGEGRA